MGIPRISFQTVAMQDNFNELERICRTLGSMKGYFKHDVYWHILRYVKQGRGAENKEQALTQEQADGLAEFVESLRKKYGIQISYTNSFEENKCECGSRKAVVTSHGEVIACSALKKMEKTGKAFPCRERI